MPTKGLEMLKINTIGICQASRKGRWNLLQRIPNKSAKNPIKLNLSHLLSDNNKAKEAKEIILIRLMTMMNSFRYKFLERNSIPTRKVS